MIMFAQHKQYYYIQGIYQRWHDVVLRHRVWYHHVQSWCTMVSEVKRRVVQENKLSITPSNITLLTVGCPPRWCIRQTQPSVSLGWLVRRQFCWWRTFRIIDIGWRMDKYILLPKVYVCIRVMAELHWNQTDDCAIYEWGGDAAIREERQLFLFPVISSGNTWQAVPINCWVRLFRIYCRRLVVRAR